MSSLLLKISLYSLLLIIAALCVGSPYAWDYPIELLSHFRVYYLAIAIPIAIAAYLGQRYKLCSRLPLYLSLVLIAFNSIWLLPWYMPNLLSTSAAPTARVLTFNVHIKNNSWDDIATAIRTVDPDIATILESTDETKDALSQRLNDTYPNIYRTTGGGITLLSRLPVISADSKTFNNGTVLIANVQIGQKVVELIAAHPLVPLRRSNFTQRNALLGELTTYIEQNSPTDV